MQWMAVTESGASGANVARRVEEEHKRERVNATNRNRKQEERSVMNSAQKWKLNNVTRRLVEVGITHPGGVLHKFLTVCVRRGRSQDISKGESHYVKQTLSSWRFRHGIL